MLRLLVGFDTLDKSAYVSKRPVFELSLGIVAGCFFGGTDVSHGCLPGVSRCGSPSSGE